MRLFVGDVPVKQVYVGSTPVSEVYVGSEKIWPPDPQSVALTTDRNGWFVPGPSDGLIAGFNEYSGIQFTTEVTASHRMIEMVDGTNDRIYEVGDVLPTSAFGWYVAPDYAFPVTVTFTEYRVPPQPPQPPQQPQRVTAETDAAGWFPTAPTHPLVAGVSDYSEMSFNAAVWANKPMMDYGAGVTYPARSVIPAGTWLFVPDTHIPVKVTITEHVPAFPPQPISTGLAGPYDWEEYTLAEYQGVLADMTSMGMKRIRISALWDRIESTKGTYWWNQIDMLVNTAVAAGIQPLVILMGVPTWARPNFETAAKGFRPEWEAFCTAVATRYAGVVPAYEIWNEPNLGRFWLDGNVSNFHDVLSRAVTRIKAADPNALVISGGMAPAGNSADTTEPLEFIGFLYTQDALQGVDGIGWHPYSFPEMPSGTSEWNTFRKMDDLKDLIVDNNHAAQIWITELGAPTGGDVGVGEAAQAAIIDDGLNLAAEDPLMGPVFVYTHKDLHLGEADMESWFGIYTSTGAPKPAVATIQEITATRNT